MHVGLETWVWVGPWWVCCSSRRRSPNSTWSTFTNTQMGWRRHRRLNTWDSGPILYAIVGSRQHDTMWGELVIIWVCVVCRADLPYWACMRRAHYEGIKGAQSAHCQISFPLSRINPILLWYATRKKKKWINSTFSTFSESSSGRFIAMHQPPRTLFAVRTVKTT